MPTELVDSESKVPKSGYSENVDSNIKLAQANTNLNNATSMAANKAAAVEQAQQQKLAEQNKPQNDIPVRNTVPGTANNTFVPNDSQPNQNMTSNPIFQDYSVFKPALSEKEKMDNVLPKRKIYPENPAEMQGKEKLSFSDRDLKNNFSEEAIKDFYNNAIPFAATEKGLDAFSLKKLAEVMIDPSSITHKYFNKSDKFFTKSNIPNPNAHIAGALDYAKRFNLSNDEALSTFNELAKGSKRGNPESGIEYFLATGEVNDNPAAKKYADLIGRVSLAIEKGKISENEGEKILISGMDDLVKYNELKSVLNDPFINDALWYSGGQAVGMAIGKTLDPIVGRITDKLLKKLVNANGPIPNWLKQKIGTAANDEINRLYTEESNYNKRRLYEWEKGEIKVPETITNDPYSKYKPEAIDDYKDSIVRKALEEAEKAKASGKEAGPDAFSLDLNIPPEAVPYIPTSEELDMVDEARDIFLSRNPDATSSEMTQYLKKVAEDLKDSPIGRALYKWTKFSELVFNDKSNLEKMTALYPERMAREDVFSGPESYMSAIDKAEDLLRFHKNPSEVLGPLIYKSSEDTEKVKGSKGGGGAYKRGSSKPAIVNTEKGILERGADLIRNGAGKLKEKVIDKGSKAAKNKAIDTKNRITSAILGGADAGRGAVEAIRDEVEGNTNPPQIAKPQEKSTFTPVGDYEEPNYSSIIKSDYMTPSTPRYSYDDSENEEIKPLLDKYNTVKEYIDGKIKAKQPITQEDEEQLRDAWEALQNKHRELDQRVENRIPALLKTLNTYLPNKEASKDLMGLSRSIMRAYKNGEFGEVGTKDAKSIRNRFILKELGTLANNIANATPGSPVNEKYRSEWDKLQEERSKNYYNSFNRILEDSISKRSNLVSNILESDINARQDLNKAMNDSTVRRYFNKLDAVQKGRLVETLAMYGTVFNKLNDSQKSTFLDILMTNDPNLRNEYNMLVKTFGSKTVSDMVMAAKKAANESAYWQSKEAREAVNQVRALIEKLRKETSLSEKELEFYETMAYSKIAQNYAGAGKDVIDFIKSLVPGGGSK